MFCCASIEQVKKAAMLFTLLTFSMVIQAKPADVVDADRLATKADSVSESAEIESKVADRQQSFTFPRWPERRLANRERIPPPPPGPYMSSALSDSTVKGLSFGRDPDSYEVNKTASTSDSSTMPIDMFSPDRPWPKNLRSKNARLPNRWKSEDVYQYVTPAVDNKAYPVQQNRMPFIGHYGYRAPATMPLNNIPQNNRPVRVYGPAMNTPAARRMPSMGSDFIAPVMGDYGVNSNHPGYRRP